MSLPDSADFLIIGAGIIGLSIARVLARDYPDQKIVILEKEPALSMHASGRNSGVLHAGFYYTADSLKAAFCRDGNKLMTEYCLQNNLPINQCGKVVVTRNEAELDSLEELYRRGQVNGVQLQKIDEKQLSDIEPVAKTCQRALFSPNTSSVDPTKINQHIFESLRSSGVKICFDSKYVSRKNANTIQTSAGDIATGYLINASGLYADKVATDFGLSRNHTLLPFKGLYLYARESFNLKTNIYPVPDLNNPFLGVHFTITADGHCKIGPTAIPAFWREHYKGLDNFSASEFANVLGHEARLWWQNAFNFRSLACQELKKYYQPHLIKLASKLVKDLSPQQFAQWGRAGIRAQLLNKTTNTLEMDFIVEQTENSLHVLNAVSPAYTCSFAFADYVVDRINNT